MRIFFATLILLFIFAPLNAGDPVAENGVVNGTVANDTSKSKENSFATMIDHALEKEFNETDELSDGQCRSLINLICAYFLLCIMYLLPNLLCCSLLHSKSVFFL